MTLKVFSIFDIKAGAYLQPFFMATTGQALRAFTDSVNDKQSQFHKHPGDYTLFELGSYDDSVGKFKNLDALKPLGTAQEMKYDETISHP